VTKVDVYIYKMHAQAYAL